MLMNQMLKKAFVVVPATQPPIHAMVLIEHQLSTI